MQGPTTMGMSDSSEGNGKHKPIAMLPMAPLFAAYASNRKLQFRNCGAQKVDRSTLSTVNPYSRRSSRLPKFEHWLHGDSGMPWNTASGRKHVHALMN
jgi:hypothetical protein